MKFILLEFQIIMKLHQHIRSLMEVSICFVFLFFFYFSCFENAKKSNVFYVSNCKTKMDRMIS